MRSKRTTAQRRHSGTFEPRPAGTYEPGSMHSGRAFEHIASVKSFETNHQNMKTHLYGPAVGRIISFGLVRRAARDRNEELKGLKLTETVAAGPDKSRQSDFIHAHTRELSGLKYRRRRQSKDLPVVALVTALVLGAEVTGIWYGINAGKETLFGAAQSSSAKDNLPSAIQDPFAVSPYKHSGGINSPPNNNTSPTDVQAVFTSTDGLISCKSTAAVVFTQPDRGSALRAMERVTGEPFTKLPSSQAVALMADVKHMLNNDELQQQFISPNQCLGL